MNYSTLFEMELENAPDDKKRRALLSKNHTKYVKFRYRISQFSQKIISTKGLLGHTYADLFGTFALATIH